MIELFSDQHQSLYINHSFYNESFQLGTMSETGTPLSEETLERTHEEIMEHLKMTGAFDEMRVRLTDGIQKQGSFGVVVKQFEYECEKFCRQTDLTKSRKDLRAQMDECFTSNKPCASKLLEKYINDYLINEENKLRSEYNHHAGEFLRKFVPPEPSPLQQSPITPKGSIQKSPTPPEVSPQTKSEDMDLESEPEDIPNPEYSPIGALDEELDIKQECDNFVNDTKHNEQDNQVEAKDDENGIDEQPEEQTYADDPSVDCDGDDDGDVSLDIDDVSSVSTADLDFDDLIEVSDDEANLMGVPAKSKIPVKRLAGDIETLKHAHITVEPSEVPIPPMDPPPQTVPVESDASNMSQNSTRNRKSNTRYYNDEFTS